MEIAITVAKALASKPRVRILEYLLLGVASLSKISDDLNMPIATASLHMKNLEQAGLVSSHTIPGKRGQQRIYTRIYDTVVFHLREKEDRHTKNRFTIRMPVGSFSNHFVVPTCGLAGTESIIGILDNPVSFYEPDCYYAQLVWLSHGFLEYHFPNQVYEQGLPSRIQISMEVCSEAAPSADNWPSDIFIEINGVKIGVWTAPGDFADKRGNLTPDWWPDWSTQYGWLKIWRVDEQGSYIDGQKISEVTINELRLPEQPFISMRIGIYDDAQNKGGLNLFGEQFGNHAQDIIMQIDY